MALIATAGDGTPAAATATWAVGISAAGTVWPARPRAPGAPARPTEKASAGRGSPPSWPRTATRARLAMTMAVQRLTLVRRRAVRARTRRVDRRLGCEGANGAWNCSPSGVGAWRSGAVGRAGVVSIARSGLLLDPRRHANRGHAQ